MNASTLAAPARPTLRIRGTEYPVLLPTVRDPRLHLAAVIISLQVLGQTAFDFQLSIAQILVSLVTCAVIEFAITFRRQRVIMWPASALLTGNGVAFILRVPGTEHGDWWSMKGWWIFAGTAAVSILSKHVITWRGHHFFNPSNFGLVLCFVLLGATRADPLAFWWGPMSPWLALALVIILVGAFAILSRLHLLAIAVTFWITFAIGIAVIAAAGHQMTARWHLGPITGFEFWRVVVLSPEVMVFLFFMITDPKTTPKSRGRPLRVYALAVALLAVLLIAPQVTEFWTKVALLGALWIVCAARPVVDVLAPRLQPAFRRPGGYRLGAAALAGAAVFAARARARRHSRASRGGRRPGRRSGRDPAAADGAALEGGGDADRPDARAADRGRPRLGPPDRGGRAPHPRQGRAPPGLRVGRGCRGCGRRSAAAGTSAIIVPQRHVDKLQLELEAAVGQDPPIVVATATGTERLVTYHGTPAAVSFTGNDDAVHPNARAPARRVALHHRRLARRHARGGRTRLVGGSSSPPASAARASRTSPRPSGSTSSRTRSGRRRRWTSTAMMGGGVCWVDIDGDGWLDLFAVNSYADDDLGYWLAHGGMPRSALFHNVKGRFTDVSRSSGADVQLRGDGCVAGDFNGDGSNDIYVTAAGNDALLWNDGKGHFSEGARAAGITAWGWHTGAAVADVNGDGRPDIFVSGYADVNAPGPADAGFPNNYKGVRDLLYLNTGNDANGHARFREVGEKARIDSGTPEHGLGAVFMDANGDGRPDLYVANDANPNRLYMNVPFKGGAAADPLGLGFRLVESAAERRPRRPERRHGDRCGRLQRRRAPRPRRHELAQAAPRRLPERPARRRQRCRTQRRARRYRIGLRHEPRRLGRLLGRSRQRHEPRSGDRERRHPRARPRAERGARAGVREPHRPRSSGRVRRRDHGGRAREGARGQRSRARGRRLRQRRARRPRRQLDRRQADAAPQHGREGQLARGRAAPVRARRRRHGRAARTAAGSCRRSTPAAATSRPRIPAPTSGSGRRRGWTS